MINLVSLRTPFSRYGGWLFFGVTLYLYLSLFKNALIDDAFITLQYVKTLMASGTWGLFPGVVANSATSPLNVLLLALVSLFTGPTIEAAFWLYLVCLLCTALLLTRLSFQLTGSQRYGWLAVFALLFNPLLISTMGLESMAFTLLFVLALYCYQLQSWKWLAIALGLLTLARPEGVLFLLCFLPFIPAHKTKIQVVGIYLVCLAPWYIFSWIYLGSFLPDTFFIKTDQGIWSNRWDFFNGIPALYYYVYPAGTILSFIFLPLAMLFFDKKLRQVPLLVIIWLAGVIHFVAYSLLGVPPFHWYYVPQVITIILLGSLGLGISYRNSHKLSQRRVWGLVTLVYFLMPILGMSFLLGRDRFVLREMPIHSNWGTQQQYREIGGWLKENYQTKTIRLVGGEIGSLAYYCDCRLLDRFSDRRWLKGAISEHSAQPGPGAFLWQANFAFYGEPQFPPDDYVLRAFFAEPNVDLEIIQEWETSTRWIRHGFLILSPK